MCSNPSVDVQSVPWFKHLDCLAGKVFKNNRQGLHLWEVPVMQQRRCEARQLAHIGDKKAQALREKLAQFLYLLQLVITSRGLLNGILTKQDG